MKTPALPHHGRTRQVGLTLGCVLALTLLLGAAGCRQASPEALVEAGLRARAAGDTRGAIRAFLRASRLQPDRVDLRLALADAYWQADQAARALATLENALDRHPNDARLWAWTGFARAATRRWDEARDAYRQALNRAGAPSPALLSSMAALEAMSGHPEEAHALLRQSLALDRDHRDSLLNLAILQHDVLNDRARALETFRRILALAPHDDPTAARIAEYWPEARVPDATARTGAPAPAAARPGPASNAAPAPAASAPVLFRQGFEHHKAGRHEAALADYRKALAQDPGLYQAAFNCGLVLRELGRRDEARAMFQQVVSRRPSQHDARFMLAVVLNEMNRPGDARRELDRLLEERPDDTRAQALRRQLAP